MARMIHLLRVSYHFWILGVFTLAGCSGGASSKAVDESRVVDEIEAASMESAPEEPQTETVPPAPETEEVDPETDLIIRSLNPYPGRYIRVTFDSLTNEAICYDHEEAQNINCDSIFRSLECSEGSRILSGGCRSYAVRYYPNQGYLVHPETPFAITSSQIRSDLNEWQCRRRLTDPFIYPDQPGFADAPHFDFFFEVTSVCQPL